MNATRPQPVTSASPAPTPLYRQPGILVTSEAFVVAGRRFPVRDLSNLRTARGPHDRLTMRSVLVTGAVLGSVGIALSFSGAQLSPTAFLLLGAAAFVPITLVSFGQRMRPRAYELWGDYRGMTVLLFSSDEEREYGQVTRALLRAQEVDRMGGFAAPPLVNLYPW
ncbi:DUF6232 family protein [Asanoa sp. WMMD1127]|uniref:DUF6232 family protein n=1 Tax=Asanoa sp. WMMD1127 TaxID=3016107 RepID=UPI002415FF1B|nr:DUF6232 family protein [Asanoa sp. WMMD1127]MDG4820376.1 DUF6232 family protein [Asanoa sp. WMMD1127]